MGPKSKFKAQANILFSLTDKHETESWELEFLIIFKAGWQ